MTEKQKLAILNAILAVNAALLNQRVVINATVSKSTRGRIRIGEIDGTAAKYYPDIDTALVAGWTSLQNARAANASMFPEPPRRDDA